MPGTECKAWVNQREPKHSPCPQEAGRLEEYSQFSGRDATPELSDQLCLQEAEGKEELNRGGL